LDGWLVSLTTSYRLWVAIQFFKSRLPRPIGVATTTYPGKLHIQPNISAEFSFVGGAIVTQTFAISAEK
jgi:hypothetical protein